MKIRDLRLHRGSAVATAWPPQWGGSGVGPWPIGLQGTIVGLTLDEDGQSLLVINEFSGRRAEGSLLVDDPETVLPKVLAALEARIPISAEEAADIDLAEGETNLTTDQSA
jgi:hypothetical protein